MSTHWVLPCPVGIVDPRTMRLCELCKHGDNVIVVDKAVVAEKMMADDMFLAIVKEA